MPHAARRAARHLPVSLPRCRGRTAPQRCAAVGWVAAALLVSALSACGGPEKTAARPAAPAIIDQPVSTHPTTPQIPPVEFGHRAPGTKLTRANMPFFDVKTYCEFATHKLGAAARGSAYDSCAMDQLNYRDVIGAAIDAGKYKEAKVDECAKASRSAYHGMWFCMNDQPYS